MMLHAYYLRIPTSKELIEVSAPDPFVPTLDGHWVPQQATRQLDEVIQELKESSVHTAEEERRDGLRGNPGPEIPTQAEHSESEEQQAVCERWLAEWALE